MVIIDKQNQSVLQHRHNINTLYLTPPQHIECVFRGGDWPAHQTNFQLSFSLLLGPETNQPQRLEWIAAFGCC